MLIILFLLGLLDIIAGILYFSNIHFLLIYILILLKGIYSLNSALKFNDYFTLFLSFIDISFSILAIFMIKIPFLSEFLSFLIILKGFFSLL